MSQKGVCAKEPSNSSSVWSRPRIHFIWQSITPALSRPAASLSHGVWNICTARPSCSCWVYYFALFPGKINCFVTVFILTSPQIKAISNHSPSLKHFPGQWTVCSHTIFMRWGCGTADVKSWSALGGCVIVCCYAIPDPLAQQRPAHHSPHKLLIRNTSAKIRW